MSIQDTFPQKWDTDKSPLVKFDAGLLSSVNISNADRLFLNNIGLPSSAAPFLQFSNSIGWVEGSPNSCFAIGNTVGGDYITIENDPGKIVFTEK